MKQTNRNNPIIIKKKRRHTRDDALSEDQFERLLDVIEKSKDPLGNKFLVITMGIGGMREGEVAHIQTSWIDFKRKEIHIPAYDPCSCTYCCERWKEKYGKQNKIFSKENVVKKQWVPKTNAGARDIPFGFNPLFENIINEFFKKYSRWPFSVATIYERIRALGRLAGIPNLHPHALRSTRSTQFANDGMPERHLMKIMGWDDEKMGRKYINNAQINVSEQLEKMYGKKISLPSDISYRVFRVSNIGKKLILRKPRQNEEKWLRHLLIPEEDSRTKQSMFSVD
jgi:integrase